MLLGAVLLLGFVPPVEAAPADLDPGFGDGGKVAVAPPAGAGEVASASAVLPDGRLVVVGMAAPARSGYAFLALRFNPDGRLDPSFGTGGRVWTDLVTVSSPLSGAVVGDVALGNSAAYAVAVAPDGNLVSAGTTQSGATAAFALLRYSPDGRLDPGFGTDGMAVVDLDPGTDDVVSALAVLPDGRILAAGRAGDRFALARFLPDGQLDPSFGAGGTVITGEGLYAATDMLVDPDGRILVAGQGGIPGGFDFALARYLPDGGLDRSFGFGGITRTDLGASGEWAASLIREPDGSVVTAGTSGSSFALVRYLPNGYLDLRFGNSGIVTAGPAIGSGHTLLREPDGRLVVAGGRYVPESQRQLALSRYGADGTLDGAFGTDGVVGTDVVPGRHDDPASALIQADGKLVLAGTSVDRENAFPFVILVRYADGRQ